MARIILIIVGLTILSACNNPQPEAPKLLQKAEQLIETSPDSAMLLIDSLFYPEKSLSRESYMRFLVRQVQVKYKIKRPVIEDTLIFLSRDYYATKNKDPHITSLAWFYSGCVHREQQNYDLTIKHYQTAEKFADRINDTNLKGLISYNIGDVLDEQGFHKEALNYYREALRFYKTQPENQPHCYSAIGRIYSVLQLPDSAFQYFHKGYDIAKSTGRNDLQGLLAQNLSVAYTYSKQYDNAERYLHNAFTLNTDSSKLPRYYLNFARLYSGMDRPDSVIWYSEKLKQSVNNSNIDNNLKAGIYHFLGTYEKANGNFNAAFDYLDQYTNVVEKITEERSQKSVYEVQRKYNFEIMRNHHERRVSFFQFWIIILLLAILLGGTSFTWYMFRQKSKLIQTQQQINILKEIASEFKRTLESTISEKNHNMRDLLLWKFDVVKKSALLEQYSTSNMSAAELVKIFHKIVYQGNKNDHWQNILSVFEEMNSGISVKIKQKYPNLNEAEYKVALLTYAEMTVKDISVLLGLSPNTVQAYRSGLRKKLGILDSTIETTTFLKDIMENS